MQVLAGMRKEFIVAHRPVIFCEIFGGEQSNPVRNQRYAALLVFFDIDASH